MSKDKTNGKFTPGTRAPLEDSYHRGTRKALSLWAARMGPTVELKLCCVASLGDGGASSLSISPRSGFQRLNEEDSEAEAGSRSDPSLHILRASGAPRCRPEEGNKVYTVI
ncbi:unnamed protein product [Pleuronectes platessa]|uniref:Uncharacterized protein n=1 Tax=Pleuronectes platessa TaxID=8262 RepID=A0A9N7UE27_PLEPL|nr:unnamed protein product [Pleuronectes platessa]